MAIIGCVHLFQSKGRNPLVGVAIGFVFGVVGLLVVWAHFRNDGHRSFRVSR